MTSVFLFRGREKNPRNFYKPIDKVGKQVYYTNNEFELCFLKGVNDMMYNNMNMFCEVMCGCRMSFSRAYNNGGVY